MIHLSSVVSEDEREEDEVELVSKVEDGEQP